MKNKLVYITKWKIKTKKYTGSNLNNSSSFLIKSLSNVKISENTFNALFSCINKVFKKKSYFLFKINKKKIISFKSLGMRMGKGKGSKKKTIFYINKGNIIFHVQNSSLRTKKDFKLISCRLKKKFPFYTQQLYKISTFINL